MARGSWGGAGDVSVFRVNLLFLKGTSRCSTSFKLRDMAVQDNDAQEVADIVRPLIQAEFRALLNELDSFLGVDVIKMGTDEGGWSPAAVQVGTEATTADSKTPDFMAANIALKSEIRKRYGQGRMFVPVSAERFVGGNILLEPGILTIQAFINKLQDNFIGSAVGHDLHLVNAHGIIPQVGSPDVGTGHAELPRQWYDVVSLRLNTQVTMLRSRKAGVGS